MSNLRGLSAAGISHLENNRAFKIAHLVRIEAATSTPSSRSYHTLTDSSKTIAFIPQDGVNSASEEQYLPGRLSRIGDITEVMGVGLHKIQLEITGLLQDEVNKAVIPNKQTGNGLEQSYLNKSVRIYRIYLDPVTHQQIDVTGLAPHASNTFLTSEPLVLFEGVVESLDIREDLSGDTKITWNVSNHFSDFNRMNGRITDDTTHRSVNSDGSASESVKRPEYQGDLGFMHANQSISVMAEYTTIEKAFRLKKKKKWYGYSSYKMEEYEEEVTREVDIEFHLGAKALPTVYGTRKLEGIPVFADTLKQDPSVVYVVYAFCEGEIEGFLDFYIDGQPIICFNADETETRQCLGNMQLGHTMHDQAVKGTLQFPGPPTWPYPTGAPSEHGRQYLYSDAQGDIEFWTYHGTNDQVGAEPLVDVAAAFNFFRQEGTDSNYWTTNHKLLDTAYVVMKVELQDGEEGRTDIPELEAVVSGRKVQAWSDAVTSTTNKTSRNPVWQTLDYMTSPIFGAGISRDLTQTAIDISKFDINNLVEAANYFDQEPRDSNGDLTYDPNFCKYWRYLGWEQQAQSEMKLLEFNAIVANDRSIYDNINSFIDQSDLSIVLLNGKYYMLPEKDMTPLCHFDFSELSGGLNIKDNTNRVKKNSISANITDPAMGWKSNSVSFYNSEFKEADSGIDKKGNLKFNYVTNYYCARNLADFQLKKSRFSREITFKVGQKGMQLYPSAIFTLTYDRYNFSTTKFRVDEMRIQADGMIAITAIEYDSSVHALDHGLATVEVTNPDVTIRAVAPPRELAVAMVTDTALNELVPTVTWRPSVTKDVTHYQAWGVGDTTGSTVRFSILTDNTIADSGTYTKRFYNLVPDTYRFYVRAVNSQGEFSKNVNSAANPIVIATTSIPGVSGFRVVNEDPSNDGQWYGEDLRVAWDGIDDSEVNADLVTGYVIQLRDSSGTDIGSEIQINNIDTLEYSWSLADNISTYAAENSGALGLYRNIRIAIKTVGSTPSSIFSPWTEIL